MMDNLSKTIGFRISFFTRKSAGKHVPTASQVLWFCLMVVLFIAMYTKVGPPPPLAT